MISFIASGNIVVQLASCFTANSKLNHAALLRVRKCNKEHVLVKNRKCAPFVIKMNVDTLVSNYKAVDRTQNYANSNEDSNNAQKLLFVRKISVNSMTLIAATVLISYLTLRKFTVWTVFGASMLLKASTKLAIAFAKSFPRIVYRLARFVSVLSHQITISVLQRTLPTISDVSRKSSTTEFIENQTQSNSSETKSVNQLEELQDEITALENAVESFDRLNETGELMEYKDYLESSLKGKQMEMESKFGKKLTEIDVKSTSNAENGETSGVNSINGEISNVTTFQLVILRHAHCEKSRNSKDLRDFDREVDSVGNAQIEVIAERLKSIGFYPDYVLSSGSMRTRMTTNQLCDRLNKNNPNLKSKCEILFSEELYYALTAEEMRRAFTTRIHELNGIQNVKSIILVGHNPGIQQLVEMLTGTKVKMGSGYAVLLEHRMKSSESTSHKDWIECLSDSWTLIKCFNPNQSEEF